MRKIKIKGDKLVVKITFIQNYGILKEQSFISQYYILEILKQYYLDNIKMLMSIDPKNTLRQNTYIEFRNLFINQRTICIKDKVFKHLYPNSENNNKSIRIKIKNQKIKELLLNSSTFEIGYELLVNWLINSRNV